MFEHDNNSHEQINNEAETNINSTLKEQLVQTLADFENFKKRVEREKKHWFELVKSDMFVQMLPPIDDLNLAMEAFRRNENLDKGVLAGLELVVSNFSKTISAMGLSEIPCEEFDPEVHEAISFVENKDYANGKIVAVAKKGFKLGEKIVRPAQVIINKIEE